LTKNLRRVLATDAAMDLSERLSTLRNSSVDRDSASADANLFEISLAVHRKVWNEFYTWEEEACQVVIDSLAADTPDSSPPSAQDPVEHDDSDIDNINVDREANLFTVWEYDKRGCCTKSSQLSFAEASVQLFKPYPKYEACTPVTRSISREDSWSAPFVPFADDPSFPFTDYLEHFDSFCWQTDFKDPDCEYHSVTATTIPHISSFTVEVIGIETARRLLFGHDISFDNINQLGVVPPLRTTNDSGLVWDMGQRLCFSSPVQMSDSTSKML